MTAHRAASELAAITSASSTRRRINPPHSRTEFRAGTRPFAGRDGSLEIAGARGDPAASTQEATFLAQDFAVTVEPRRRAQLRPFLSPAAARPGSRIRTAGVRGPACPVLFRPTRGSRGAGQLATGWLSDHTGRKPLIATGMLVQAAALGLLVAGDGAFTPSLAAAALLGVGTAMVYPTLIAAVSDATQPRDRARVVGVYRFWRDFGFVLGALIAGIGADATSPSTADPDRRLAHRRQRPARRRNLLAATARTPTRHRLPIDKERTPNAYSRASL